MHLSRKTAALADQHQGQTLERRIRTLVVLTVSVVIGSALEVESRRRVVRDNRVVVVRPARAASVLHVPSSFTNGVHQRRNIPGVILAGENESDHGSRADHQRQITLTMFVLATPGKQRTSLLEQRLDIAPRGPSGFG